MNQETIVVNTETAGRIELPADNKQFDIRKFMGPQELAFMDVMMAGINTYMNTNLEAQMAPIIAEIAARVESLSEKLSTATPKSFTTASIGTIRLRIRICDSWQSDVAG